MSKSDLTINPTGTTPAAPVNGGRFRSAARRFVVATVAAVALLFAAAGVAQAADGLSHVNTNNTNLNGQTLNFGVNGQSNLPSQVTIYLWSNSASGGFLNLSTRTINADIRLNNSAYERAGGNCGTGTTQGGYTFRASFSYQGGASFRSCQIILRLKAGTAVGTHNTTLDYASVGSGSANMSGTVTEEHGNVIRVQGPNGETGSLDYGEIAISDSASRTFTLRNTGTTQTSSLAAALNGASSSYSITGDNCPTALPIFSSCQVTVKFEPTAELGPENKSLDFSSGSGHSASIGLVGEGMVPTAELEVSPASWSYDDTPSGFGITRAFTVSNQGNTTLDLNFAFDGGSDPSFTQTGGTCGATLAVASSCTYVVEFDPEASGPAVKAGSFTVTGTSPLVVDPATQTIAVDGNRVAPAASMEVRDSAGVNPKPNHNFSSATPNNSAYTFRIVNTGNVPIPNVVPTINGAYTNKFSVTANTCGSTIARYSSCDVTVTMNGSRVGSFNSDLVLTPGASSPQVSAQTIPLTGSVSGLRIVNDIGQNMTNATQKRWLSSLTLSPGGALPSDIVRVSFEVDLANNRDIDGVEIGTTTSTNDSAVGGYQNLGDLLGSKIEIDRKAGSSQALVHAEVPLNVTGLGTGNGQYGFDDGTTLVVCLGGGDYKTDNRRVWFRVRDDAGTLSQSVGSIVRFNKQVYSCPDNQGPQISGPRVLSVDGVNQPGSTFQAAADKNQPVTFQFSTRARSAPLLGGDPGFVEAVNWRIRNQRTGAMFRIVGGNYAACSLPCIDEGNYTSGAKNVFDSRDQGTQTLTIPGIPSRGRWVVEAAPQSSNGDEDDAHFFGLGVIRVNDHSGTSPHVNWGGTLTPRPNTDSDYTIAAITSDPADPVNALDSEGGRAQIIEWDLDGNTTNGPLGDGFETRYETDSATNLPAGLYTEDFSTTGKTPGPFTIRARVTDNGSFSGAEALAESRIFEYTTTINSLPVPQNDVVYFEADETQPRNVEFRATDVDNDEFRVDITPNGANDGTLGGNLNGPIGDNTKPYTWAADYTGTDTFDFIPTDDHLGTGDAGVLTVKVRPNTTIDSATFPDPMLHPDAGNPATRYLGATTSTDAEFEYSSPQTPIDSYECKLTNDGEIVSDWSECSDDTTGDISFTGLSDGLHKLEVRAINEDGDEDGTPVFRTWRVDNTGPDSEVRVGPPSDLPNQQPRFTNDTTPTYIFRATSSERSLQQYVTYECRVMWGPAPGIWYPCGAPSDNLGSGPVDIVNGTPDFGISDPLTEGTYEVQVRGTDEVGNLGSVLVEQFTVDTTPPETALASGPEGLINTRTVDYVLGSSQGQSTFLCKLEGQNSGVVFPLGACPGPAADGSRPTFSGLDDDIYTLTAIAVDPGQNQDPTPLEVEFEVDATEPTTSMDANVDYGDGPTLLRRTQSRKVDIAFTGADTRQLQGFQCRIDSTDDGDWNICSSPQRFSGLSDGDHKVEIRAKDEAGNFDSTPEVLEWNVDQDPPVTEFTVAPDPVTGDADPTFEFEANEAISGSVCILDGAAPVACTSPVTLADLGVVGGIDDGVHTLTVRSTDIAGNVELTPASVSWRQDTVNPEVTFTSKPAAFMPLGDADFAWDVKDGDPLVLAPEADAECALDPVDPDNIDPGEWTVCDRDLTLVEADNVNGPHFLAVRAIDQAGNVSPVATHEWTVLGSKPNPPVIDDASPADGVTTRVGTARFAFHHELDGTGALAGLFCRIDDGTQARCDDLGKSGAIGDADGIGSFEAEGLSDGAHTFTVVARDIAGNISDPTTLTWDVQRGAPVTQINFGPSGSSTSKNATFQFVSDKSGTFECRIDGGAWEACSSPVELEDLSEGAHSFSVRAVSSVAPVGVKDPTPPTRNWNVDTVAPDVSITSAPEGQVVSYSGEVAFTSTDPDAGFQCKVDSGLFDDCTSPWQVTGLAAGERTVTVRAVDPAGNVSTTPATATWVVLDPSCSNDFDGTPPNCVAKQPVEGPALTAKSTGGTLSLASLGSVDLPQDQVELVGKIGSDGRWFVPADGVSFAPVVQTIEDAIGPGSVVEVTISISATGNGWGVLTNGGGQAKLRLPVRADVDAKLGGAPLFAEGTECSLRPITFDLVGTWNAGDDTAHLEQTNVAFPKLTGCGTFKTAIDTLLELPRSDIEMALDFALTRESEQCVPPQTGTPPNCVNPPDPVINLTRPVVKGPKKIKFGKKAKYRVTVTNNGDTAAPGTKLCLVLPKKHFKGKAKRCVTVNVPAGKAAFREFTITRKGAAVRKARKVTIKATATYTDGSGVVRTKGGKATPKLLRYTAKQGKKTGSAK